MSGLAHIAGSATAATLAVIATLHPYWAAVFAVRAVGDFRYAGAFKRVRGTRFARWDSRLFPPLGALLALGCTLAARAGSARET